MLLDHLFIDCCCLESILDTLNVKVTITHQVNLEGIPYYSVKVPLNVPLDDDNI
jgi:hypothetical protein